MHLMIEMYRVDLDVVSPLQAKGKRASALDHAFLSAAAARAGGGGAAALSPPRVVDWRCADGTVVSDHLGLHFQLKLA